MTRSAPRPTDDARLERARAAVAAVPDPEIPVVTLTDLGIVRDLREEGGRIVVELTPTYTGCPATNVIRRDVRDALAGAGFPDADVRVTLSPAWTTDWIGADAAAKLRAYGIAPPAHAAAPATSPLRFVARAAPPGPACPRCGAADVERISEHGSTPCKALYRCRGCLEPFDYFKPY